MTTPAFLPVPPTTRRLAARLSILALVASLATVAAACNDDSTSPDEKTVVGTWEVTSFVALGMDFIAEGMSITVTITEAGSITFSVENDQAGICDPGPDCTDSGTYSADESTITLDPGTEDEETFAYTIQNRTMVWTGEIDGNAASISMSRS